MEARSSHSPTGRGRTRSLRHIESPIPPEPTVADVLLRREHVDLGSVDVQIQRPRRVHSPTDTLRLLIGLALVALGIALAKVADRTVGGAQEDLVEVANRLPNSVENVVVSVAQIVTGSIVTVIAVVLMVQRRWRRLGVLVVAALTASLVMLGLDAV